MFGGERFVSLVKKEAYKDKFLEQAAPQSNARSVAASNEAPAPAVRDAARTPFAIVPPDLGIEIDGQTQSMVEGEWYAVRDLADVFVSVMAPGTIAPTILHDRNPNVSDLGSVESAALVYLVAFELERFDLRYELGTEHPRLGWSPRPPASAQDPRVAGPDGIDTAAPLARTGMVSSLHWPCVPLPRLRVVLSATMVRFVTAPSPSAITVATTGLSRRVSRSARSSRG